MTRDRDDTGRPRNARARDELGRPLPHGQQGFTEAEPVATKPDHALDEAQHLLDEGRAFRAHEVLEAMWKSADDADRNLWRGLAQLAVGITHAQRGNQAGASALLLRSAQTLSDYSGREPFDIDVDGVRDWARSAAADRSRRLVMPRLRVTPRA